MVSDNQPPTAPQVDNPGGTKNERVRAFVARSEASHHQLDEAHGQAYWRANRRLMAVLLVIWALVSFGFGIVLVEPLNSLQPFGIKLGFWFAQQGSILTFVILIFVYVWRMHAIDARFHVEDDAEAEDVTTIGN